MFQRRTRTRTLRSGARLRIAARIIALLALAPALACQTTGTPQPAALGALARAIAVSGVLPMPPKARTGLLIAGTSLAAGAAFWEVLSERDRARARQATETVLRADPQDPARRTSTWVGEDAPAKRGSTTLTAVTPDGHCKSVREVGYLQGREYVQDSTFCRAEGSDRWTRRT